MSPHHRSSGVLPGPQGAWLMAVITMHSDLYIAVLKHAFCCIYHVLRAQVTPSHTAPVYGF